MLALVGRGLPDKAIAARLGPSAKTVNFHVANLLAKLGVQNRTEAVRLAYERELLVDAADGGPMANERASSAPDRSPVG